MPDIRVAIAGLGTVGRMLARKLSAGLPGLTTLLATRLQDVDLALFDRLGDGDVLFIDSGHAGGIGSDVNRIFFSILPRLAPGVLVHFHDVFLPWDYPRPWAKDLRRFFTVPPSRAH